MTATDADDRVFIQTGSRVVVDIGPADIHWAWLDTTLNAFSVDLTLTTITVCVDINNDGTYRRMRHIRQHKPKLSVGAGRHNNLP
jgi:hypothetical protein